MKTLIKNGRVIDPANRIDSYLNLILADGKVAGLTPEIPQGDFRVIDAAGKVVCPGFLDIHMHESGLADLKTPENSIFGCLLRMGVTTGLGGNCGYSVLPPDEYAALVSEGLPISLAFLAGHGSARIAVGYPDEYAPLPEGGTAKVRAKLQQWLDWGCYGISYGIRYCPGMTRDELMETAALCRDKHLLAAAHVRDDADYIFDALAEFMEVGTLGVPLQISHLGSMGGFGQMAEVMAILDAARLGGMDVTADCYPYNAFSTRIGDATYDPGFLERYRCGYDAIALCGGKYDGQRCTEEIFWELRRNVPDTITVAHVMKDEDVNLAMAHPAVMLCTDGLVEDGAGHPRAAGTFPRLIHEYVGSGKLSLYQAIEKMTSMPAARIGLAAKGNFTPGSDGDAVIFDPEAIRDLSTFENPTLPPAGIDYVLIGGEIACDHGKIQDLRLGKVLRRV